MSDIASIGPGGTGSLGHTSPVNRAAASSLSTPAGALGPAARLEHPATKADRVEVSDVARFMDMLRRLPEARLNRVQDARQAIEQGRYESEAVLDQTIARLGEDLT